MYHKGRIAHHTWLYTLLRNQRWSIDTTIDQIIKPGDHTEHDETDNRYTRMCSHSIIIAKPFVYPTATAMEQFRFSYNVALNHRTILSLIVRGSLGGVQLNVHNLLKITYTAF